MNSEVNRLETFVDWPQNAVVTPERLAKAGFYSTGEGMTVECFSCHLKNSEWSYGDQVMAKHKTLSPRCQFVLDPTTSGNVPITQPSAGYRDESARLNSFQNWPVPHIVTPEALARAGFYYINSDDNARCAFCSGTVAAWEPHDDPDKEHKKYFPNCPYVISTINPRLLERLPRDNSLSNVDLVANENLEELGVNAHTVPKKPSCATFESRIRTYNKWPAQLIQTPDELAQAGFYYEGVGDQVRCFHCDGGLRHWDPEDDPWTEHARWFPLCSFLRIVKGQDFIMSCSKAQVNDMAGKVVKSQTEKTARRHTVTDEELENYMTSDVALTALNIGLNVQRVRRALKEKIEKTGTPYSRSDALVLATINLQLDEEAEQDIEPDCSIGFPEISNNGHSILPDVLRNDKSSSNVDRAEGSSTKEVKKVSLEEENRILKEARLCKICMDSEVGVVFLPCGHFATCVNCAPNLQDCPVCRSTIKATVRTFLA